MVKSLRIKGFRALKDMKFEFPVGKPLVLIGENATGKSTTIEAVELICAVASGTIGQAIHNRGGWDAVAWAGTATEIELTVLFSEESEVFKRDGSPVEYMVRLGKVRSVPSVLDEQVRVYSRGADHRPFTALQGGAKRWVANVQTRANDSVPAQVDGEEFMGIGSSLAAVSDETRYPTVVHVKDALRSIAFYPSFMLGNAHNNFASDSIGARPVEWTRRIGPSGRDLLNALHTLSTQYPREWESLGRDLRAVFPWCDSLRFPPGPGRGLITMTWVDKRSGATLYLDDMSEGMRVYLALLAALHAPDSPALIAFDEPERSLHPRAMSRIVKVIESRAERTPVLIATHADRMLDHLESPADSLGVTRFSSDLGVTVERPDPQVLGAWLRDYSMSELRSRNLLEAGATTEDEP